MNIRIFKSTALIVSLAAVLLTDCIINPLWPIWGEAYVKEYNGGNIKTLPSNLVTFLADDHYSPFQHFSSIFSLICLYLSTILIVLIIVFNFLLKKKKTVIIYVSTGLLTLVSIFLPFTCNYSAMPFVLYCFFPLLAALGLLTYQIIDKHKTDSASDKDVTIEN